MATSSTTTSINNNDGEKRVVGEKMQVDVHVDSCSSGSQHPPRVPSPMITVTDESDVPINLSPNRDRKKSPVPGVSPRQRKRSQPVRGELLPDPDKLLKYKHHDKTEEEVLEDPTFPGGQPKLPPEPRQSGEGAERKRSTVTFCPVIQTIEK